MSPNSRTIAPLSEMPHNSDSDDDPDYVPPEDTNSSGDERNVKRARKRSPSPHASAAAPQVANDDPTQTRHALWADFQASVSAMETSSKSTSAIPLSRMVKIEKRFRFAGEDVIEIEEVPEDSEAAKKWPLWQPPETPTANAHQNEEKPVHSPIDTASDMGVPEALASGSGPGQSSTAPIAPIIPTTSNSKPFGKRPGPRKPKVTLAPLPGAQKAKKLTTLDKSTMDWRAHVRNEGDSGLKDELEANRRGGGYLEKVEFLQRVEERKADALDASKSKRRRP